MSRQLSLWQWLHKILIELTGGCYHDWGWPWRNKEDGKDYQTCNECAGERESELQFGAYAVRKREKVTPISVKKVRKHGL